MFLYSDKESKKRRAIKYYGLKKQEVEKQIIKIDKEREKHYKFYTNRNWKDMNNYDLIINVDSKGVEKTAQLIEKYLKESDK